jgi:nitroreductase
MNDTIDLLKRRRSLAPQFLEGPAPDAATIETLLAIAARVPDHGKLAPWRFVLFEGDARARAGAVIEGLARADDPEMNADRLRVERERLTRAPLVVGVVSRAAPHFKIPEWEQVMSAGAVCMNLIVAATALGFGACWLRGGRPGRGREIRRADPYRPCHDQARGSRAARARRHRQPFLGEAPRVLRASSPRQESAAA